MITVDLRRRLAIAAPVMQLVVGTALLVFAARPADLMAPVVAAVLLLPAALGLWVFAGRSALSRVLLAAWAPAGGVAIFLLVVLAMRLMTSPSVYVLGAIALVPLLALVLVGVATLRGQQRGIWLVVLALWLLAIGEAVTAVPLSEQFGTGGDMQSLAGAAMLLFAPGVAFGSWGGLALAARVSESPIGDAADGAQVERVAE